MAHLKRVNNAGRIYYYIVQSRRRAGRVTTRILEYLGRDPDPLRLQRAKRYWGVKPAPARNGRAARAVRKGRIDDAPSH